MLSSETQIEYMSWLAGERRIQKNVMCTRYELSTVLCSKYCTFLIFITLVGMCHYPIQNIFQVIKELNVKDQTIKTSEDNMYIYLNSLRKRPFSA